MKRVILSVALIMCGLALQVNLVKKPFDVIGGWMVFIGLVILSIVLFYAFNDKKENL